MPSLRGKTVVVTGASSGIGRAAAVELARRGADLVIGARRAELLEQVAAECGALGVRCTAVAADVTNRDDCAKLIAAATRIDVLVNNAGFAVFAARDDTENGNEVALTSFQRTPILRPSSAPARRCPSRAAIHRTRRPPNAVRRSQEDLDERTARRLR